MTDVLQCIQDVVAANQILANEGVLDAFGHVSARHPGDPQRFLLSTSKAPELVQELDILEYNSDSEPVSPTTASLYAERFIHGEIYRARPDVQAICHHHSPSMLPFCISREPLVPVYQHGAMIGNHVPRWDSRDDFGDTNLLIVNKEQGASLARALGQASMVLMQHHGATVVGKDIKELVFRSITSCKNAEALYRALALGPVPGLTPGEIDKAGKVPDMAMARAWSLWHGRI